MNNSEEYEDLNEEIDSYVYIPDEGVYGTVISRGAWASIIEFYDAGVKYIVEIPNDEFTDVNEIGIGYINEEDDN